ncbi:hypothetical protein Dsin_022412 [Dipteronia sinensis]|uniref:Peptidase A1 domain-containing protein n=1 Tax=Dipteronia sinensis TaxID=43782 RepID=A0AAE0A2E3_9ROSI|nr:hypothetical protein Dsin_022412 [Dipteronia sinensis]
MDSLQSFVVVVSLLVLILLPKLQFASSNKTASFSLKLIHRDSPESPLYPGPMNFSERVERYLKISESRVNSFGEPISNHNRTMIPNMMRPSVYTEGLMYLVQLEIGAPINTFYLILDTGSSLTWMQCQPCIDCFPQKLYIYDPKQSQTFVKVPCNNPLCQYYFKCINEQCSYNINYYDASSSQGYAARETFHIKDEYGQYTHISNVFFGCSNSNKGFRVGSNGVLAGIMGLNTHPISFITQMGSFIMRRFSYCLVDPLSQGTNLVTYLKFGLDMGYIGGAVQKTPFLKHPKSYSYYLNLLGISVNNKRLNFPPDTFKIKPGGDGGFSIDSGAILTYIDATAYVQLEAEFVRYFSSFNQIERRQNCAGPIKLCYEAPLDFPVFPSMIYHFQGADLTIAPESSFIVDRMQKYFMLAIAPFGRHSILGAFQQHNTRFVYDIDSNVLAFVPDDCSKDNA